MERLGFGLAALLLLVGILALMVRPLHGGLARMARAHDELRRDVLRTREASLLQLAESTQGIRGEIHQAQRTLAEMRALEQGRLRQLDQASDSLRRLEAVLAGSASRGAAGERILARALHQIPPDLLACNAAFGGRVVEYALRLPGGRLLPIDSKWTGVSQLERLEAAPAAERKRLLAEVARDLRLKIREMIRYLDPERTLGLGLVAVPDAVYAAAPEAHAEGYREGVLVVPYSLALPYALAVYRLTLRFGAAVDSEQLARRLHALDELLRRAGDEVESRLSRGLVQVENARDALRAHLADARRAAERLRAVEEPADTPPAAPDEAPCAGAAGTPD